MKNHQPIVLGLVLLLASCTRAEAQSWKTAKYDTAWLPITEAQLRTAIRTSANDATGLYQLWRRARYQKLAQEAFDTFRALKDEQPKNANAWAMYCMAIEQRVPDDNKPRFNASTQELDVSARGAAIKKAKRLNLRLWLSYAAQARFEYNTTIFRADDQVRIYKKALSMAPNLSFTNNDYAAALSNRATQQKASYREAVLYDRKAQKLAPISCEPSLGLIMMHRWRVPDAAKKKQAAQAYSATIPPQVKLNARQRAFLAKQGIKAPA